MNDIRKRDYLYGWRLKADIESLHGICATVMFLETNGYSDENRLRIYEEMERYRAAGSTVFMITLEQRVVDKVPHKEMIFHFEGFETKEEEVEII